MLIPTISRTDWQEVQSTLRPIELSHSSSVLHTRLPALEVGKFVQTPRFTIVPPSRLHLKETVFLSCRHPRLCRLCPLHLLYLPQQTQTQRPPLLGSPHVGQQIRDVFIQERTWDPLQEG